MIRIGIDASGGDNGEKEVILAVIESSKLNNDIRFIIFGVKDIIVKIFDENNFSLENKDIEIVDAKDKIGMNEHPVFSLRSKTNSSLCIAANYLLENKIDIFISAGNTGALVALAQFYLKPLDTINRPAIASLIPTNKGKMLLIDSGSNVDCKPEWLYKYARLGITYYKIVTNNANPRVGLLSVGVEENKGNALTLEAYKLISADKSINFIGNVEARDVPYGVCDILVTDGFAGNVFLKTYEGVAKLLLTELKDAMYTNIISKLSAFILKPYIKKHLAKYNAKIYGGAPILGANYIIIKCHGNADKSDYKIAIDEAKYLISNDIINKIKADMGI